MSAFKEIVERDVHVTFLNADEFSDFHVVDGREMPAQIDENEQIEREKRAATDGSGYYANQKLVYVPASEFGPLPKQGSLLELDGRRYRVADAVDERGIYSITIEAYRA